MPRDQRIADDERSLDVFDDAADARDERPELAPNPNPPGLAAVEVRHAGDADDDPDESRPTHAAVSELPEARAADGDADGPFAGDEGLTLDGVDEVQAAGPDPPLNLPDDAAADEDELDYAGPPGTLTFSGPEAASAGDELHYSGPEPDLNLTGAEGADEDDEGEPVPSVTQDETTESIVFNEEANQGHPIDPDEADPPADDPVDPSPPDPVSDDFGDTPEPPGLPEIGALPEPPYELELNPNPPYDLAFDDSDDEDDDMGDG